MNQITQQVTATLRWMVDDMNRRRGTGMMHEPVSEQMQLAESLLAELESGHIHCYMARTRSTTKTRGGFAPDKYLTPEQLQAVRDYVATKARELKSKRADSNWLIVEILAGSGIRARELCNLRIQDCPHYHGKPVLYVRDGKGKVSRPVQIHESLGNLIREYAADHRPAAGAMDPLLEGRTGKKLSYGTLRRKLRLLGEEMGMANRLKAHGLRHSYAVKLYGVETDLLFVAEQLGHQNIATTTIYARTLPESARRQVEKME